tara:strand:+ start:576 stop:869 length:294 start_codon:yes stop_codon:yes gene_type:complete
MSYQLFSIIPDFWVNIVKYALIIVSVLLLSKYIYKNNALKDLNINAENYYWVSFNTSLLILFIIIYIQKYSYIKDKVGQPGVIGEPGKKGIRGPTGL